jgi:hypothetical protein
MSMPEVTKPAPRVGGFGGLDPYNYFSTPAPLTAEQIASGEARRKAEFESGQKRGQQYRDLKPLNDLQSAQQGNGMGAMNPLMGAMNPGLYGGQPKKQSYEQYLAARHPLQHDVQLTREQFENPIASPVNPAARMAQGGMAYAGGGISSLGGYSDGGRLLKGPGDGMSDNIPAQIGAKQPARLADGEFVVPADVVSHLGNGSTDAGAKQLYKMMDRIRAQRTGKKKQAPEVNPAKAMPA